jgi:uncharacterized protein YcnI
MNIKLKTGLALAAIMSLALPAIASAHVTVQPEEAPAGTFTRLDVRVPNERDDAGTVKVDVELPDGFYFASYEPVAGWDVKVTREKLDEPVEIEPGFEATEQVKRITWTGDGQDGLIPPGAFQDFGLSVRTPDAEGETVTIKALQTYEGGEVVRWIGAPDSEEPAPTVTLTAPEEHGGTAHSDDEDEAAEPEATAAEPEDDDSSTGLAIAGIVLGGLGLAVGGTALARSGRNG